MGEGLRENNRRAHRGRSTRTPLSTPNTQVRTGLCQHRVRNLLKDYQQDDDGDRRRKLANRALHRTLRKQPVFLALRTGQYPNKIEFPWQRCTKIAMRYRFTSTANCTTKALPVSFDMVDFGVQRYPKKVPLKPGAGQSCCNGRHTHVQGPRAVFSAGCAVYFYDHVRCVQVTACGMCRARRVRCTGEQPCAMCFRRGEECIYDPDSMEYQQQSNKRYLPAGGQVCTIRACVRTGHVALVL